MIEIIKEINIEVSKPNVFQAIVAKQYDMNTRFIKATFVDGGNKIFIDPNATVTVVINALRPDGESKGFDGVVNEDGTVTVPLHSWMLELVGTVTCDISVIDTETGDNKKLTTTSFTLLVEKAAYGGDGITSDPQYDLLVQLLDSCSTAEERASEALVKSEIALAQSADADSKYDACVEATAAANKATAELSLTHDDIVKGGHIEALKEKNSGAKVSMWVGSEEDYNAITEKENNCLYLTDKQIDFIVETGTYEGTVWHTPYDTEAQSVGTATWAYRKWNSGVAECWCRKELTVDFVSDWGNGHYASGGFVIDMPPTLFIDVPCFNISLTGSGLTWGSTIGTKTTTAAIRAVHNTQHTGTKMVENVYAVGCWK